MTLTDAPMAILATLVGLLLGVIFFDGLWWTVQRALALPQPALLVHG
jgi:F1F0 ATPase subunit 2